MSELKVGVTGMTCGHCAQSVTGAVSEVPGVESVEVDLAAGEVAVVGQGVDLAAVQSAITAAGYEPA